MNLQKKIFFLLMFTAFAYSTTYALPSKENLDKQKNEIQRDPPTNFYDFQRNTLSNIETVISNYGMIGYDRPRSVGSGYYPRGSRNQYIFGGGIWYAAQKRIPNEDSELGYVIGDLVSVSYDPSLGNSYLTPGRIEDGPNSVQDINRYKVFFSTDFSEANGEPIDPNQGGPNWPIWDTQADDTVGYSRYFGNYQYQEGDRNLNTHEKGPAMISGEDIFTTFHDLDLSRYSKSVVERRRQGYPLGLQYEFTIYSWGFGQYQNFFFCLYDVINMSEDTLYNCWLAPIMDVDLARSPFLATGANNDRVSYWYEDPYFNMAYQFTNPQFGEQGQGFGYLGFDFLESPTIIEPPLLKDGEKEYEIIDKDLGGGVVIKDTVLVVDETHPDWKFLRKDSAYYHNSNQLGLKTFRNWNREEDKDEDVERYSYISSGVTDLDQGEGDKRYMMATGAFHMRPGDTSRTVVCIMIATPSKTGDADGTRADRQGLYDLDVFAQSVYDNNFRAPRPPNRAVITEIKALNNGAVFKWDETSELTTDNEEQGLDFLGYRIERARDPELDTFNVSQISPNSQYNRGAGPFGWKEIATYELPKPFTQSVRIIDNPNLGRAAIDSFMIVGPVMNSGGIVTDTSAIRIIKKGQGVLFHTPTYAFQRTGQYIPIISGIDEREAPWGAYYKHFADRDFNTEDYNNLNVRYKPGQNIDLFDSALVGVVEFDPARVPYNPLFTDPATFEVSKEYLDTLKNRASKGVFVRYEFKEVDSSGTMIMVESSIVDTVYFVNTGRTFNDNGTNKYIVDGMLPIPNYANAMTDTARVKRALDSVYSFIQQGLVDFEFFDFESSDDAKQNVILPYMKEITNDRTFTDIGDDNRDGKLNQSDDFYQSEKLINNTPYYYRILSYDQGDASLPTPVKVNTSVDRVNQIEIFPEAEEVGEELDFEIIELDSNKMNGLYDFKFYAVNSDRAKQLFLGDTLELEFNTGWEYFNTPITRQDEADLFIRSAGYNRATTLVNLSEDSTLLYQQNIRFNPNGCYSRDGVPSQMYENTAVIVADDRPILDDETGDTLNTTGVWNNTDIINFDGTFTTGDFTNENQCNVRNFIDPAFGTLGFEFKFAALQNGGRYRANSIEILEGDAQTTVSFLDTRANGDQPDIGTLTAQEVDTLNFGLTNAINSDQTGIVARPIVGPRYASFNNGPVDATIEFVGTGTEEVTLEWGQTKTPSPDSPKAKVSTFNVPYLDIKVTNNYKFSTISNSNDEIVIGKPRAMEHINIDPIPDGNLAVSYGQQVAANVVRKAYPDPRNLPSLNRSIDEYIGNYNIAGFAHINVQENDNFVGKPLSIGRPANNPDLRYKEETFSGLQGRYYLSTINSEGDTIDFVNVLSIAGAQFIFDNRTIGRRFDSREISLLPSDYPTKPTGRVEDFEVGDKVRVTTTGGASGLPFPNAKLKVVLKNKNANSNLTDDQMEGINVVPNPYYISHENEQTPYQNKLYFTKVPPGSTINIYTVSGQLIQSIKHDPFATTDLDRGGRVAVNVWDLIMENGLRAQSQSLVAQIISPDGAETMKKFSIVVGTFNTFDQ